MLRSRLRCHFCGTKSSHSKGTLEFQCPSCEAHNFFDSAGNVVDAPTSHVAQPFATSPRPSTFTRALPESLEHQQNQAFCRTCAQNQLLYNETLANYLPEESHPDYRKYERAIPKYKEELQRRYPLVCRKCAPIAQTKINRADYYGMSQNAAKMVADTKARRGLPAYRTRDDRGKKSMRAFLRIAGATLYLSLLAQIGFHAYCMVKAMNGKGLGEPELSEIHDPFELPRDPPTRQRMQQLLQQYFSSSADQLFEAVIPWSLAVAAVGLFYNPGIMHWYHHTDRMEAVHGQRNYFYLQIILLILRYASWHQLSNPEVTATLDVEKLVGFHGAAILVMLLIQAVANRGIQPVLWKMKGKIMPKPTDTDVLGAYAGPQAEHYIPQASAKDPWRYLRKDEAPFDIGSLAAPTAKKTANAASSRTFVQQPSPEPSDHEEDFDAMETDYQPVMRSSQSRSSLKPRNRNQSALAFGGMTDEVFGMQSDLRNSQELQKRPEQPQKLRYEPPERKSPFYGNLPPAPMSMERRLRNPVVRPINAEQVPLSQQKDFMTQMGKGVKPLQFQEKRSNFELKQGSWVLPSDVKEVGLEDRFEKTFTLADPSPGGEKGKSGFFGGLFGL